MFLWCSCLTQHVPLQEELAREKEVKVLEAERHRRELEQAAREAEAERARHREAYLRWAPRSAQLIL